MVFNKGEFPNLKSDVAPKQEKPRNDDKLEFKVEPTKIRIGHHTNGDLSGAPDFQEEVPKQVPNRDQAS